MSIERGTTAEEIREWYTPIKACAVAANIVGVKGASAAVWQLLVGGMIETACHSGSRQPKDYGPTPFNTPMIMERGIWSHFTESGSDLWNAGYARFWVSGRSGPVAYRCFDIRCNPRDVHAHLPPLPPTPTPPKSPEVSIPSAVKVPEPLSKPNKGGRPSKDWWTDFWVEMCRLIYEGAIRPEMTQADIGRLMHQWVSDHGHEAGDTVIKDAARKLVAALKK